MPPEIMDDLQAELRRLRKENAVLRQVCDILIKAAAIFAKEGTCSIIPTAVASIDPSTIRWC